MYIQSCMKKKKEKTVRLLQKKNKPLHFIEGDKTKHIFFQVIPLFFCFLLFENFVDV